MTNQWWPMVDLQQAQQQAQTSLPNTRLPGVQNGAVGDGPRPSRFPSVISSQLTSYDPHGVPAYTTNPPQNPNDAGSL